MRSELLELLESIPRRDDSTYTSLEEVIDDIGYLFEDYDQEQDVQNVNYMAIRGKNKEVLKKIHDTFDFVDLECELFVSKINGWEDRETSFEDNYNLKENEEYYIEGEVNKPAYEFIKNDLTQFCLLNQTSLNIVVENSDAGTKLEANIDEKGKLQLSFSLDDISYTSLGYRVYMIKTLLEVFGSTSNLNEI